MSQRMLNDHKLPPTYADNVALPTFAAATDRYLLPARPKAANPLHAAAAGEWDRQTGGHRTVS